MYLTIEQVTLVANPRKVTQCDPVVYDRELRPGERILTTDGTRSLYATAAERYGRLYYDSQSNPCIVPDRWDDADARLCRLARGPEEFGSDIWAYNGRTVS